MSTTPNAKKTLANIGENAILVASDTNTVADGEYAVSGRAKNHSGYKTDTKPEQGDGVYLDKLNLHIIWRETDTRVDVLAARVREGVDVEAASEFCRWLRFSGILKLLELARDNARLPCKGQQLSAKVDSLIYECGQWFANHERANKKPHPQVPRSELERITSQLQALTAEVAKLSPSTIETANAVQPALLVIEGGVKT